MLQGIKDATGNPITYKVDSSRRSRLISAGGDGKEMTKDDLGVTLEFEAPVVEKSGVMDQFRPETTWLERRKAELKANEVSTKGDAFNIFVGLLVLSLIYFIVQALDMKMMEQILGQFLGAGLVLLVIIFQDNCVTIYVCRLLFF